ncbi:MAG: hypothetical protein WAM69_14940 [Candidatus Sulfotelmatobacter sp.]
MKIELFYVPGCPNHQPAIESLVRILSSKSLQADIAEVAVHTEAEAKALRFPGSPTIRVNGADVEPESAGKAGLACRLYNNGTGVPSEETIRRALSSVREGGAEAP